MGYVWCDGYVWDMSGVRYANNLLKNPATKRLSGKKRYNKNLQDWTCSSIVLLNSFQNPAFTSRRRHQLGWHSWSFASFANTKICYSGNLDFRE